MASEIFVDTSGFYSLLAKRDSGHAAAAATLERARRRRRTFVTTDYVLDETATLLKARRLAHLIPTFFTTLQTSQVCHICWTDAERFETARRFFLKHLDQAWSFTDCVSFCLMKEKRIREALTKDAHFQHAGFKVLINSAP